MLETKHFVSIQIIRAHFIKKQKVSQGFLMTNIQQKTDLLHLLFKKKIKLEKSCQKNRSTSVCYY